MKYLLLTIFVFIFHLNQAQINGLNSSYQPLDTVTIDIAAKGQVKIKDAKGHTYFQEQIPANLSFQVAGALGHHTINLYNKKGTEVSSTPFLVDCESGVEDPAGYWHTLFEDFKYNQLKTIRTEVYQDQIYQMHELCPRNDANAVRGTQYIYNRVKDGVELFGKLQHEDGMIYDIYRPIEPGKTSLEGRYYNDDHFVEIEDGWYYKQRFPVENDLEHFYVQWLWRVWKATGDSEWMHQWLPNAIKALQYSRQNPLRWSEKYQLLKRGFTIDTWDFQPDFDGEKVRGDHMEIHADKTEFGIMHGDNTGYAYACNLLAEMLDHLGRKEEAQNWKKRGESVLQRIIDLSWNGKYFYHFIPEDSSYQRDLGVDQASQISLSNAMALQRNIPDNLKINLLNTYQNLKEQLPSDAPGEYFGIYPPIETGFTVMPYHYINGGVFAFIAGELAIGAFDHGEEEYGVGIMKNTKGLMDEQHGRLPYFWIGKKRTRPETEFTAIDLTPNANVEVLPIDYHNEHSWVGPGAEYALHLMPRDTFSKDDIPFYLVDFAGNQDKGYLGIGKNGDYVSEASVPVNQTARSIYLLHVMNGGGMAGWMTFHYADGSSQKQYVESGKQINGWYFPKDVPYSRTSGWTCKTAWQGHNGNVGVGVYAWGVNNPKPDQKIEKLTFNHQGQNNSWLILGITLSDQPKFFEPPAITRYYVNTGWNAGTFISAIVEGIGGIKNDGLAFDQVTVSPKWYFAGENDITMTARIPASNGYVRYRYVRSNDNTIELSLATSADRSTIQLPLPINQEIDKVMVNSENKAYDIVEKQDTKYIRIAVEKPVLQQVKILLK